jgi:uncharacterized membrane protein YheB (UPF0754 family)
MSSGNQLQEMEVGTKQSKTAVNANAKPAQPMEKLPGATWEDLGGPTPDNYSPTNDSAKLKDPAGSLKKVSDAITNRKGKTLKQGDEAEVADNQEVVAEEPATEEVVAETEAPTEEVVAEEETVEEETVEYDMEEDLNALVKGLELSEENQGKAKTIFEAAINSKASAIRKEIQEEYDSKLDGHVQEIKEGLQERVDSYLEYVADEWFDENQLAIENGLKADMTESFLEGMKGLFEEHYVEIPEEKYDVLKSMVEKLDDMETKLNEQIEKNITLNGRLAESVADGILESVSDGLAATQKEKLASLAESVEFESDEEYREKLETLKESYFTSKAPTAKTESLSEGVDNSEGVESHSASMASYLKTLSSFKQ